MITTHIKPECDTVIYDGNCRFCRSQIALLRWIACGSAVRFVSLHDPAVADQFPEISAEQLHAEMYTVDRQGHARGGADAVRFLSRRLPLLWPLALVLHIPGSLPLWRSLYAFVARHRYRIAGSCEHGGCRLP